MKRIIVLILIICSVVFSIATLSSCDNNTGIGNGGDIGNVGGSTDNTPGDNDIDNNPGNDVGKPDDGDDNPSEDNPGDDNPGEDNPGEDNPGDDNPGDDNPGEDNPGDDNPGDDNPGNADCSAGDHVDENNDKYCDLCSKYVIVVIDFYVLNDIHGKFCDTDNQPGVDELGSYFALKEQTDDNVVLMSSGDMWQGTAESNLTNGLLLTEWMNEMNFVSMTLGNHEFDWGEGAIRKNLEVAEFPFLALNIYDNSTGKLADYCTPSVMIQRGDIKIGIIGAIGNCYSSISSDMVAGVNFKVGKELTELVKAESDKLRQMGADLIVYSLHDGYGSSKTYPTNVSALTIASYYDVVLSGGYVDLVFEAHSHQRYTLIDSNNVYHLQGGGENAGLSHVEIEVNSANGENNVTEAGFIDTSSYTGLEDDPRTEALEDKYSDIIDYAYSPLGVVSKNYSDSQVEDYVASFYLKVGMAKWGEQYDIVLGGGFLKTRSPYDMTAGMKTYADILSLLPFDNRIVLCSVSGYNLKNRFINTSNGDYHTAISDYGNSLYNISNNETYYIVVDTYTAYYAQNGLTIVDFYDDTTFARDLLVNAIKAGMFETKHDNYTLTSIPDALAIGNTLGRGESTSEYHYVKGTVKSVANSTYGNVYLVDEKGNEIYVYGLNDLSGNRYDSMTNKPDVGDTIIIYCNIYHYYNSKYGSEMIELSNSVVIEIN